jgi:hypothetical protein
MANIYELIPIHCNRKSFYRKAFVLKDKGAKTLLSYTVPVVAIAREGYTLEEKWNCSQTTLGHVREFLQQEGFPKMSKAQIAASEKGRR